MSAQHGFDVLADGVRRDILAVLAEHGGCSSGEIAEHIGRGQRNTISSHLRVLRAAGAVAQRREGRYRYYSLDPAGPPRDPPNLPDDMPAPSPGGPSPAAG